MELSEIVDAGIRDTTKQTLEEIHSRITEIIKKLATD